MEHVVMERAKPRKKKPIPVDERLVVPEQRAELVCGELIMTPPAGEPHARKHIELGTLLQSHVAPGYLAALDMLTRMSESSDFAPDASIYPEARDDEGHRQLEVMAFEIVSQQRRSVATHKAREMANRGVRRIFCIDLNTHELLEWTGQAWQALGEDDTIEDACLSRPVSVRAVLYSTAGNDEVAKALLDRGSHVFEERVQERVAKREHELMEHLVMQRLGRDLNPAEQEALLYVLEQHNAEHVVQSVLQSKDLAAWLAQWVKPKA